MVDNQSQLPSDHSDPLFTVALIILAFIALVLVGPWVVWAQGRQERSEKLYQEVDELERRLDQVLDQREEIEQMMDRIRKAEQAPGAE